MTPASDWARSASATTRVRRLEHAVLVVERAQCLALFGEPDHQRAPRELRPVEHVAGVAELVGDEVGDIDRVVDRPLADGLEPLDKPVGARADRAPGDDPRREERARAVVPVVEGEQVPHRPARRRRVGDRVLERAPGERRHLARAAQVAEAIGAVAGDLDIQQDITPGKGGVGLDRQAGLGEQVVGLLGRAITGFEVRVQPRETDIHKAQE
jgi:hypothetical protein